MKFPAGLNKEQRLLYHGKLNVFADTFKEGVERTNPNAEVSRVCGATSISGNEELLIAHGGELYRLQFDLILEPHKFLDLLDQNEADYDERVKSLDVASSEKS